MTDENNNDEKTEKKKPFELPNLDDETIRQLVLDFCDGRVFSDRHVSSAQDLGMVFMPLGLGGLSDLSKEDFEKIGLIYEYVEKAGPRSINGMPMFFSMRMLNKHDAERVLTAAAAEQSRRGQIEV